MQGGLSEKIIIEIIIKMPEAKKTLKEKVPEKAVVEEAAEKKIPAVALENKLVCSLYDQEGHDVGKVDLPKEIFGLNINKDLIHQAVVAQISNSRQVLAHVKDRSDVSGGGKKPWRQKSTGRARHGSIRSPIWIGGGVTFGPTKERNFAKKINKKMKKKALFMALSGKFKDGELVLLDHLGLDQPKTKIMSRVFDGLAKVKKDIKRGMLVVMIKKDENIIRACRNIPKIGTIGIDSLNIVDVLRYKYLVMTKDGIDKLKTKSKKGEAIK